MSKIRSIITQALDNISDTTSRNKLRQDLLSEVIEQVLNDDKEPPKRATVLRVHSQKSTGPDLKEGKQQYLSAILRIEKLHDSIPDPSRMIKNSTVSEVNKAIDCHLLCFSINPIDSGDSKENASVLLEVGDIVPVEKIEGAYRFGVPTGKNKDFDTFDPSQALEDQEQKEKNVNSLAEMFEGLEPTTLGSTTNSTTPAEDAVAAARANTTLTDQVIENGRLPDEVLTTLEGRTDFSGRPVRVLTPIARDLESMMEAFEAELGVEMLLTDSYRTYERQQSLYDNPNLSAATPGTSKHGWGLAIDMNTITTNEEGERVEKFNSPFYEWMSNNAVYYGFHNPAWAQESGSSPEAHHWEFIRIDEILEIYNTSESEAEGE